MPSSCGNKLHDGHGLVYYCQKPIGHDGEHEWSNLKLDQSYLFDVKMTWKPNHAVE